MKHFLAAALILITLNTAAQKQTFDLTTFMPPKGWKNERADKVSSYSVVNKKDKGWCQIGIYKSTLSKGSIEQDFENDWNELVATKYGITEAPQATHIMEADGWKIKTGTGQFTFNKKPAAALLTTFSGYGRCISIIAITGNQRYLADIETLIGSVDLNKPEAENTVAATEQPVNTTTTISPKQDGFAFSTTNFDDGWFSAIQDDWVLVSKEDIKIYLWYALPFDASIFTGTGLVERDYYWDNYITKYFSVQSKQYRDDGEFIGGLKPKYVEGWGTDKQTGVKRFIAMRLEISPNTAYLIVASAPNEETLRRQFPKANDKYTSDLTSMNRYNKFAISANDILGQWQKGDTKTAQWYYTSPSGYQGYAGMSVAATSATFNFNAGGNYTSIHNGATGTVGNLSTFQQNYKGKYSVTDWTVTATNRWQGKTDKFDAWFSALKGGRILWLKDGGMEYSLLKTK